MSKLFQITKLYLSAVFLLLVLIVIVDIGAYKRYRDNIILQEQKQLLLMAETVSKSLGNYVNSEIEKIDFCFSFPQKKTDINELKALIQFFLTKNNGIFTGALIINKHGKKIYSTLTNELPLGTLNTNDTLVYNDARIITKHLSKNGYYEMFVLKQVLAGSELLNIIFCIDLQEIYLKIVAPIKIGNAGYSVVKDKDLAIIMHHAKSQIGMDAIYDRSSKYPDLNLQSLNSWLKIQTEKEYGYSVIDTYVWDDPNLTPIKRLVAYSTVKIQDENWIVNSTLPIDEISSPLIQMSVIILLVSSICFAAIIIIAVMLTKAISREEAQKREIQYLREINRGMELTAKQSEEIRHYQRVQSLGIMSSHIAHEFNNYLTPIAVYAELIADDEKLSDESRSMLREMLSSIDTAKNLSRALLDYSRQDTGAVLKPLNLTEDTIEAFSVVKQLTPHAVKLRGKFPDYDLYIMGRQGMMQSVLMNLCKNAFSAMEKSENKELNITLGLEKAEAVIRVRDSGCGVSEEAKRRIFEPFYTTKGSRQGTGLGLSVVQNVINGSGGRIEISSVLGEGTEFFIHIPITDVNQSGEKIHAENQIRKIIYVGENSSAIETLQKIYETKSITIQHYTHPSTVIAKLQKNPDRCQVIIAEYVLPMMNGVELLEIVRRSNPNIMLILAVEHESPDLEWYVNNRIIDKIISLKSLNGENGDIYGLHNGV